MTVERDAYYEVAECSSIDIPRPGCAEVCTFEGGEVAGVIVIDRFGTMTFVWECPSCHESNETPLGEAEPDPDYERDLAMEVAW